MLLDVTFGTRNFRNEIIWCYSTSGRTKKYFARKHDVILFCTKTDNGYWSDYRIPISQKYLNSHYRQRDSDGRRCRIRVDAGKKRVYYPDEGMICNDWWNIPYLNSQAKERVGYPTQKPLALLDRIIRASSNEGDTVLDPFCGCATALVAAERLGRRWVGIDIAPLAVKLVKQRRQSEMGSALRREGPHRHSTADRSGQTAPTIEPTSICCTGSSRETAGAAVSTSHSRTSLSIMSWRSPRVAPITLTTFSCCAAGAIPPKAPCRRRSSWRNWSAWVCADPVIRCSGMACTGPSHQVRKQH